MAITGNQVDLYQRKYSDLIEHELQQKGSVLEAVVTQEAGVMGERMYINRIGASDTAAEHTQRWADVEPSESTFERRYLTPINVHDAKFVDELDLVRGANPTSQVVQQVVMGMGRQKDRIIFNAFGGSAAREVAGASSAATFLSANTIAVNDNGFGTAYTTDTTPLHEGKLNKAVQLLSSQYVNANDSEIFVVGSANQLTRLRARLVQVGYGRKDYMDKAPLTIPGLDMSLDGYLGLRFVIYNGLADAANLTGGDEYVYVMAKDAIRTGVWKELSVKVTPREDKVGTPIQIAAYMSMGAVRMDENKIVRIVCDIPA